MNSSSSKNGLLFAIIAIVAGTLLRIFNFEIGGFHLVPIVAISLFSGAILKNKLALVVPVGIMLLSDIYLQLTSGTGFYGIGQLFVYGAFVLIALMGSKMNKISTVSVLGTTVSSAMIFWIVSNLGVFAGGYYGYSVFGFINTYAMALPFLQNDAAANALFFNPIFVNTLTSFVLFGAFALAANTKKIAIAK